MRAASLALLWAAGTLLVAPAAHATFPGATGRVAFQTDREGDWELYTMNPGGADQRPLVDRPGTDEFNAAWSPNGTAVAFQTGHTGAFDIAVVRADGTGLRVVVGGPTDDRWPRFCLDDWLVFQRTAADGASQIWKVRSDGSGLAQLTHGPGTDIEPACSPDGRKVAFSSTREGQLLAYEIGLDSSGPRKLTTVPARYVDYSPDGALIAFAGPDPTDGNTEIFTQNLATGQVSQRTFTAAPTENVIPTFVPAFGGGVGFLPRAPLGATSRTAMFHTRRLPDDELVVATLGVGTGTPQDPCDELGLLPERIPSGPGPADNGKNSGQNVQPTIACRLKSDGELAVSGTAGPDRITIKKAGDRVVVEHAGKEEGAAPADKVKRIRVSVGIGDTVTNSTTLPLTTVSGDPSWVDTRASLVDGTLTISGSVLDQLVEVKLTTVDGKQQVDVRTSAGLARGDSSSLASFPDADVKRIEVRPGALKKIFADGSLKDRFVVPPKDARGARVEFDKQQVKTVAPAAGKTILRFEAGPNGLEVVPYEERNGKLVRVYTITIIRPGSVGVTAQGGAGVDDLYFGPEGYRGGQSLAAGGARRAIPARVSAGGGADRVLCRGPAFVCLTVSGGPGNDRIDVRDGKRSVVDAGPGRDTVLADAIDVVRNAEVVTRG